MRMHQRQRPVVPIHPVGFPCIPIRDARSAEWELMTPLSLWLKVRGYGFQMHHYALQARGPAYELAVRAAFFCLLFFAACKEK
jgi:hypothetical protein